MSIRHAGPSDWRSLVRSVGPPRDALAEIRELVARIDAETAAGLRRARERRGMTIREPLEFDLGEIVVSGTGELVAVELNPRTLERTGARPLARALVAAVNRGRARVEQEGMDR